MTPTKPHKPSKLDDLKAQIGKAMPTAHAEADQPPKREEPKDAKDERPHREPRTEKPGRKDASAARTPSTGRGVQFYMDDNDRKILNGLAAWFVSQDRRMTDSQVIKASIRLAIAQQGAKLLNLADEVRASDRRRKPKGDRRRPSSE